MNKICIFLLSLFFFPSYTALTPQLNITCPQGHASYAPFTHLYPATFAQPLNYYSIPYPIPPFITHSDPAYVLPTLPTIAPHNPYIIPIKGSQVDLRWFLTLENYSQISLLDLFKSDGRIVFYHGLRNNKFSCGYIGSMRPGLEQISFHVLTESAPDTATLWSVTDAHQAHRMGIEMSRIMSKYPILFSSQRLDEIRKMYLHFTGADLRVFIPSLHLTKQSQLMSNSSVSPVKDIQPTLPLPQTAKITEMEAALHPIAVSTPCVIDHVEEKPTLPKAPSCEVHEVQCNAMDRILTLLETSTISLEETTSVSIDQLNKESFDLPQEIKTGVSAITGVVATARELQKDNERSAVETPTIKHNSCSGDQESENSVCAQISDLTFNEISQEELGNSEDFFDNITQDSAYKETIITPEPSSAPTKDATLKNSIPTKKKKKKAQKAVLTKAEQQAQKAKEEKESKELEKIAQANEKIRQKRIQNINDIYACITKTVITSEEEQKYERSIASLKSNPTSYCISLFDEHQEADYKWKLMSIIGMLEHEDKIVLSKHDADRLQLYYQPETQHNQKALEKQIRSRKKEGMLLQFVASQNSLVIHPITTQPQENFV